MAFTRKFLKALGIEEDKIEELIDAHLESVNPLKEALKEAEEQASKAQAMEKELSELKANNGDSYKLKYETLKKDFDSYKQNIEAEKSRAEKEAAYVEQVLKPCKIAEKLHSKILKLADIDGLTIEDGKITGLDEIKKAVDAEWADFKVDEETKPSGKPNTPPNNDPIDYSKMSDAEYYRAIHEKGSN